MSSSHPASFPTTPTNQNANAVLHLDKIKSELTSYLHAAAGCPNKSTFIQAMKMVILSHGQVLLLTLSPNTYLSIFQLAKVI